MTIRLGVAVAIVKGAIMATLLQTIIAPSFLQTLAVAVSSATVSGVFLLIATHMNIQRTARPVEEVKQIVEANFDGEGSAADD